MTAVAQTKDSFSPPLCLLGDHLMSSSFGGDCEELVTFTYCLPLRKLQKSVPSTLLSLSAQVFLVCLFWFWGFFFFLIWKLSHAFIFVALLSVFSSSLLAYFWALHNNQERGIMILSILFSILLLINCKIWFPFFLTAIEHWDNTFTVLSVVTARFHSWEVMVCSEFIKLGKN